MEAERYGRSFYQMAAHSASDPKGKQVFLMMADEELEHLHFLKKQYDSLLNSGHIDSSLKLGQANELDEASPIFSDALRARIGEAHFEMTSLSVGVQLERDAMKFYRDQSEAAEDPDAKQFFAQLADWEAGHYRSLLAQMDELKGDYWDAGGFSPM